MHHCSVKHTHDRRGVPQTRSLLRSGCTPRGQGCCGSRLAGVARNAYPDNTRCQHAQRGPKEAVFQAHRRGVAQEAHRQDAGGGLQVARLGLLWQQAHRRGNEVASSTKCTANMPKWS